MTIRFDGQVVVVTGAGNGLGRSHALAFAARGAKVVVNDYGVSLDGHAPSSAAAAKVVAEITAAGGEAIANAGSVAAAADVEALVKQTLDTFGRVDVVVNNAGVLRDKSFAKMPMDDFAMVLDVHLMGTARVTQGFWAAMKAQQYGRVIFTTSAAGLFGSFGQASYAAAKSGMLGLMNTLVIEGAKDNIRVNCIGPIAATRMSATADAAKDMMDSPALSPNNASQGVIALATANAPSGVVLNAGGGAYSLVQLFETQGSFVGLGDDLSAEKIVAAMPKIADIDGLLRWKSAQEHGLRLMKWAEGQ